MKHATAKIVPKLLNFKQKQGRMDIAQDMLMMLTIVKVLLTVFFDCNGMVDYEILTQGQFYLRSEFLL